MEVLELALDKNDKVVSAWTNADNKEYVERLPLIDFLHFLEISGLTGNPDIILIADYVMKAQSILEIGGGYGRVINACQQLGYSNKLTTIEYTHSYADFMKRYITRCEIIEANFLTHSFNEQYELALMMWTTISIFSPDEQIDCLKKCSRLLKNNGYAVIDLLISNHSLEAKDTSSKEYCLKDKKAGTNRYAYMPSTFEIIKAAAIAGFAVSEVREYIANSAARCLVILRKS